MFNLSWDFKSFSLYLCVYNDLCGLNPTFALPTLQHIGRASPWCCRFEYERTHKKRFFKSIDYGKLKEICSDSLSLLSGLKLTFSISLSHPLTHTHTIFLLSHAIPIKQKICLLLTLENYE